MEYAGPGRLDNTAAPPDLGIFGESGNTRGAVGVFLSCQAKNKQFKDSPVKNWMMLGMLLFLSWVQPELLRVSKPAFLAMDTFKLAEKEL